MVDNLITAVAWGSTGARRGIFNVTDLGLKFPMALRSGNAPHEVLTFGRHNEFHFKDERGHLLVTVAFPLDPGGEMASVYVYDPQGEILNRFTLDNLGPEYPTFEEHNRLIGLMGRDELTDDERREMEDLKARHDDAGIGPQD